VAAVLDDLRMIVKLGLRDIGDAALPALRGLAVVRGTAASDDVIQAGLAVEAVVTDAVTLIGAGYLGSALSGLFGLDEATRGRQAKQRRQIAAQRAGHPVSTFNRHEEPRLLRSLAVEILRRDAAFRRQAERAAWADRPLTDEQKAAAWAERFGYYERIAAAAAAMRHHVIALVVGLVTEVDEDSLADELHTSLWWYARFLAELDAFNRSPLGGRWVLPDPEKEVAAASAVYQIGWHSPFNERADSLLRLMLADVPAGELVSFARRLEDSPEGSELLGMWEQWAGECRGDFETADDRCHVHGLVDQADRHREIIERDGTAVRNDV
jgi:uncharacterized cupin superfamily protein